MVSEVSVCFGAYGELKNHNGEHMASKAAYFMAAKKQR
jgi:hypothetical protein